MTGSSVPCEACHATGVGGPDGERCVSCRGTGSVPPDGTRLQEIREAAEAAKVTADFDHDLLFDHLPWLLERVNELERENERLDRCFAREQDIADNFTERVNQLEQENERLFLQDAQHRAMYVKEYDKVNQLAQAFDLLSSAYAHLESGQKAKASRLRAESRKALSAAGEDA